MAEALSWKAEVQFISNALLICRTCVFTIGLLEVTGVYRRLSVQGNGFLSVSSISVCHTLITMCFILYSIFLVNLILSVVKTR